VYIPQAPDSSPIFKYSLRFFFLLLLESLDHDIETRLQAREHISQVLGVVGTVERTLPRDELRYEPTLFEEREISVYNSAMELY
jgi:hypothetical protein